MINWSGYDTGNHRVKCPVCGRGDRDRTLGLTVKPGGNGVCHCFRCAYTESYRLNHGTWIGTAVKQRATAPTSVRHEGLSEYGKALWSACKPISDVAHSYLEARRCFIPPADGDLRWHSSVKHPSGYVGPCLVGLVTDVVSGEPLSLHRTWIQANGSKATVDSPRMLLGGHRKQGGVIRLWPDEAVTAGLGIGEGIETALSLAWGYSPVWACIDAGNMAALPALSGIECLMIAADNDTAGNAGAMACAKQFTEAGIEVFVTRQAANDLNDTLQEAA